MFKHLLSEKEAGKNVIYKGATYRSNGRVVMLPESVAMFNPVEEEKSELSEKDLLIIEAVKLGCGAESSLKRNSIETLKKKIEEAL